MTDEPLNDSDRNVKVEVVLDGELPTLTPEAARILRRILERAAEKRKADDGWTIDDHD